MYSVLDQITGGEKPISNWWIGTGINGKSEMTGPITDHTTLSIRGHFLLAPS